MVIGLGLGWGWGGGLMDWWTDGQRDSKRRRRGTGLPLLKHGTMVGLVLSCCGATTTVRHITHDAVKSQSAKAMAFSISQVKTPT
jgi:hypothetical protein